jgi:hypothetical protein
MGENLAKRWDGLAVYLPAIQKGYAEYCYRPKRSIRGGKLPSNISPRAFDFLKKRDTIFYQKYGLYSVGQHTNSVINGESCITARKDGDAVLVGDSGGFQLGKGTLEGLKQIDSKSPNQIINNWKEFGELERVTRISDTYFDFSMTLDAPLWAIRKDVRDKSPFGKLSTQQLTDLTYLHLKHHAENTGKYGKRTKWLNVLQGIDSDVPGSQQAWYDMAKQFDFEGWAIAGEVGPRNKRGVENFFRHMKTMQLEGQFDGKEWIHFLGMTRPKWAVLFTAFQKVLRKTCSENIQVSYDSATHSILGGRQDEAAFLPAYNNDLKSWIVPSEKFPTGEKYAVDTPVYPLPAEYNFSPFSKFVTLNDMNPIAGMWKRRKFDTLSSQLLIAHNAYTYARAFIEANELAFSNKSDDLKRVPQSMSDALGLVEEIFTVENWDSVLSENIELLNTVFGMYGNKLEK